MSGVEPWLTARLKALTVEALYKAKRVTTRCYQEGRSVRAKISGEGVVPGEYFFDVYKTKHILLSDSANCTVLRAVDLTQYRRVTDGRTDRQTELL